MTPIPIQPSARALIFDLDGTLADTMPLHWEALHETFAAHGITCPQSWLDERAGIPTKDLVPLFNREFGLALDTKTFTDEKEARAVVKLANARPIEPMVRFVEGAVGLMPLAVATSANRRNAETILAAIGLDGAFDTIVTREDVTRQKPAPDIFLEAARRLGCDPRHCQAFEDSAHGLEAARQAGMMVTDIKPYLVE